MVEEFGSPVIRGSARGGDTFPFDGLRHWHLKARSAAGQALIRP